MGSVPLFISPLAVPFVSLRSIFALHGRNPFHCSEYQKHIEKACLGGRRMGRASPPSPAPQWQAPKPNEGLTIRLKVITPLFGGGYEPREVDPVRIIRPATVRGHLRFWWRALYGGQYSSSEELFQAESALWRGGNGKPEYCWQGKPAGKGCQME